MLKPTIATFLAQRPRQLRRAGRCEQSVAKQIGLRDAVLRVDLLGRCQTTFRIACTVVRQQCRHICKPLETRPGMTSAMDAEIGEQVIVDERTQFGAIRDTDGLGWRTGRNSGKKVTVVRQSPVN